MRRPRRDGRRHPDLLDRPPARQGEAEVRPIDVVVDPVAQLSELVDLYRRALLGPEEFDLQKERLLDAYRWREPAQTWVICRQVSAASARDRTPSFR
jgi:hypothetical protein